MKEDITFARVFSRASGKHSSAGAVPKGLWEPNDLPGEGSHFIERHETRSDRELGKGLSRTLSVWCFVSLLISEDRAREKNALPRVGQPAATTVQL